MAKSQYVSKDKLFAITTLPAMIGARLIAAARAAARYVIPAAQAETLGACGQFVPGMRRLIGACLMAAALSARAAAQQPAWQELGPIGLGGRVTTLAVDPASSSHLLIGTPAAGVWESNDAGTTWHVANVVLASAPLSALAIDPATPSHVIAGTGSIDDAGAVTDGIGLLASTDSGANWALQSPTGNGPFIAAVLIWPGDAQRVLVGTDLGVQLSTDGGATFSQTYAGDAISTFARDPLNPNTVFASARRGLLRSNDRGASWTQVSAWPLLDTDTFGAGMTTIVLSAQTAGRLYATVQVLGTLNQTDRALLLRSDDGGATFTTLTPPTSFCPGPSSCGYAHALAIDPANDARLLLGGEALMKSTDRGATWQIVTGVAGVHQIAIVTGHTFIAGRFGVAEVDTPWSTATLKNTGLGITAIRTLDASTDSTPRLLAATEDSGTLLNAGGGAPWNVVFAPNERTGPAKFDPFHTNRLFASRPSGLLFKSEDNGATFQPAQTGLDLTQSALDIAPLEPSLVDNGTWFTGRLQLYSSTDSGSSWSGFRPIGFPEIAIIAPSPVVSGRVYFTTNSGGVLYKADGINTYQMTLSSDANLKITSVFLDPTAQNALYVAATNTASQVGRIFKSADFGVTWTDVSPDSLGPTTSLVKDRFGALYVGTRDSVWRSANDGFSWTPFRYGLNAGGVNALKIAGGFIFAGTTGRGVFRVPEQELFSLESIPGGVTFLVDGVQVTTPFLVHWDVGTVHTITPVLRNTTNTREEFVAWGDNGSQNRTITTTTGNSWLMAAVKRSFLLQASSGAGGSVVFTPSSTDGFFPERSFVTVIPVPAPDYRFSGFGGDMSGDDGLVGYAIMDKPRSVTATFAPLRMTIATDPAGTQLTIDGTTQNTPVTFQWAADSAHTVSAPAIIGTSLDDPVLAFDGWTDLRGQTHTITMSRDTFVTDLTARYLSTVQGVTVPAGGTRTIVTASATDAPRMAAMSLVPRSGGDSVPSAIQFVRGRVDGTTTNEIVLGPSATRTWTNVFLEQDLDGVNGRARIALFNPTTTNSNVGFLLRDPNGSALAAQLNALIVPSGAQVTAYLDELLALPRKFECLLSVIADQPLVTSVHSIRGNVRASTRLDPILVAPFTQGDQGVPLDARVQVAFLTPSTTHELVLVNTGFSALAGSVAFFDESGAALAVDAGTGPSTTVSYSLAAGGYQKLMLVDPGIASMATLQIRVTPSAGQPAPALQLLEARTIAPVNGVSAILPRAVPPSTPARTFRLPVNRAARTTGIVFTNTSTMPVHLTLKLVDNTGVQINTATQTIAAGQQLLWSSDPLAAGTSSAFQGTVVVTSDIPVHAVGHLTIQNERGETIEAGFSLPTDAAPGAVSPLAIDGDSFLSEWWFANAAATATHVNFDFRGAAGRSVYFPIQ